MNLYDIILHFFFLFKGSPYNCDVLDLNGVKKGVSGSSITACGEGLQRVKLGYPARFDINPHIADHGSISVLVKGLLSHMKRNVFLTNVFNY